MILLPKSVLMYNFVPFKPFFKYRTSYLMCYKILHIHVQIKLILKLIVLI